MAIEYPQPCQDINLVSAAMPLLFLQQLQIDKPLTLSDGNAIRKESTLPNGNSPSACIGNSNQRQAGKTSFFLHQIAFKSPLRGFRALSSRSQRLLSLQDFALQQRPF
jgi:hypothetical protein